MILQLPLSSCIVRNPKSLLHISGGPSLVPAICQSLSLQCLLPAHLSALDANYFALHPLSHIVGNHLRKENQGSPAIFITQEGSASVASSEAPQDQHSMALPGHLCDFRASVPLSFMAGQAECDTSLSKSRSASQGCPGCHSSAKKTPKKKQNKKWWG